MGYNGIGLIIFFVYRDFDLEVGYIGVFKEYDIRRNGKV